MLGRRSSRYVDTLDLPDDVRERIDARLAWRGFVDEIVPFVLALRDVYAEPDEFAPASFDTWLREHFGKSDAPPGFEHSMFLWEPPEETDGPGLAIVDEDLVRHLVAFYDALYLQEVGAGDALEDQLACAYRDSDEERAPAAQRVRPIVRAMLRDVQDRVDAGGEVAGAVEGILTDDVRLDAVSISLVHFLDEFVCSHYRIFATRVHRERQLRQWMEAELEKPGAGRLWRYLEHLEEDRRYGVVIVVDGLQGHLVEALSGGRKGDVFLRQILGEHHATRTPPAGSRPAPDQQIDFLEDLVSRGFEHDSYLPFLRGLYSRSTGIATQGISTTPTISVRNLPVAKTGAAVAGESSTSIPNFHFVDRDYLRDGKTTGRAYYFYGNDALLLESIARRSGMRTLFDRMPVSSTFSCAAQYDRGAHYRVDAFLNLALGEKMRDVGELRCIAELRRRAANEVRLRALRDELMEKRSVLEPQFAWWRFLSRASQRDQRVLAEKLIARIAELEQESMPQLLVYYNPWPDHFAHFTGPFSDEILAPSGELNRLDYWLGALSETYREAGVWDRTLFGMAGDHGLSPVFHMLNPEVAIFDRLRQRGLDFEVVKISSDEGEGPKLTNPLRPPSMRGLDVIVASTAGGNYMLDLFADHSGDNDDGWTRQPLLRDLQALRLVDGSGPVDIVSEIEEALADSLDYLVVRVEPCDFSECTVAAIGRRDGERSLATMVRRGDRIHLQSEGGDLLGLRVLSRYREHGEAARLEHARLLERCLQQPSIDRPETWCDEHDWRRLTVHTSRPDSVNQLAHLYDLDRAGTINLFPRDGIGYNTVVPGRHAGESFHEKDAFAGVWGEPVQRSSRPAEAVVGAVPATVYGYIADSVVAAGVDGFGYSAIPLSD